MKSRIIYSCLLTAFYALIDGAFIGATLADQPTRFEPLLWVLLIGTAGLTFYLVLNLRKSPPLRLSTIATVGYSAIYAITATLRADWLSLTLPVCAVVFLLAPPMRAWLKAPQSEG